ncbi:hypothetical protein [Sphingomonas sp. G-3-2-10]|uniref:hypothetical protein n=1 Tax=Sphingomonas sp. G-3-2-10 TaxID=2728838 RepID=UPI00146D56EA|nr:hypothetical protein [Sphingomonas sp. G-3-2-10]NML08342.1 hypothetical protein [Sphingomonas sp. G-3-2-10]
MDELIGPMVDRIESKDLGGRSHSLAALIHLLLLGEGRQAARTSLTSDIRRPVEKVVVSGTFVHAEFALIVAARLAEAGDSNHFGFLDYLLKASATRDQTERFKNTARKLARWKPWEAPLSLVLPTAKINSAIARWSSNNFDVAEQQDAARQIADQVATAVASSVSSAQLDIFDHWTRYRADQFLQHYLGRHLYGERS